MQSRKPYTMPGRTPRACDMDDCGRGKTPLRPNIAEAYPCECLRPVT